MLHVAENAEAHDTRLTKISQEKSADFISQLMSLFHDWHNEKDVILTAVYEEMQENRNGIYDI